MLRRLLAVLLVAAIALPLPAAAVASAKGCAMKEHAGMAAGHDCCCKGMDKGAAPSSGAGGHKGCPMPASSGKGSCDCVVKADPGRQPAAPVVASSDSPLPAPSPAVTLLPAALSTPQRQTRAVHVADPPPSPSLVSRPQLCSWTL